MVFIALADGTVDDEEIEEIKNMFEQITTLKLERKEILESIDDLKNNEHSIKEIATGISPYLSNEGKETVLRGAIAISKADGIVVDLAINAAFCNGRVPIPVKDSDEIPIVMELIQAVWIPALGVYPISIAAVVPTPTT